jgi:hypothetical protein
LFRLHKWYLDCVTADGDVVICYAAALRWGLLHLGHTSLLARRGRSTSSTRLGRPPAPSIDCSGITFDVPRLRLRGIWRGAPHESERVLWSSPRGQVRWQCHLPMADVELEHAGRALRGTGYVEHLTLEVAPWRLPIQELRWGRFHGEGRSLVWIQWTGDAPLRLCLRDGVEVEAGAIGDAGFDCSAGRLELANAGVLRHGRLGRTALAHGLLAMLPLPRAVRSMQETKWLADARLFDGARCCAGSAVHEVVRWA